MAYIVPNRCHDGAETPCAACQPAGLAASDAFLKTLVPQIEASAAYKDGGLIAITFDQAPQAGPGADAGSCCDQPTAYANLAPSAKSVGTIADRLSQPIARTRGRTLLGPVTFCLR